MAQDPRAHRFDLTNSAFCYVQEQAATAKSLTDLLPLVLALTKFLRDVIESPSGRQGEVPKAVKKVAEEETVFVIADLSDLEAVSRAWQLLRLALYPDHLRPRDEKTGEPLAGCAGCPDPNPVIEGATVPRKVKQALRKLWTKLLECCGKWDDWLDLLDETVETLEGPPPPPDCILWLGDRRYTVGNHPPVTVAETEHRVLQAFLGNPPKTPPVPSMDRKNLWTWSGLPQENAAPTVLRNLCKKHGGIFAPAIRLPGGRGKGGYTVTIRAALPAPSAR
jgi:hypothetical protein